ncbi:MAG TPA: AI-2E family transporter [Gammaproteobacteria bacterium]|nr:AI-2E family transporter [Gammaproteobacteria bacterium]
MTGSQKWTLAVVAGVLIWLLYLLAPVLTPFMLSALLSYLFDPVVDRLEARRLPRTLGVIIVFLGLLLAGLAFVLILFPVLHQQISLLIDKLPQVMQWFQDALLPRLSRLPGVDPSWLNLEAVRQAMTEHWQQLGSSLTDVLGRLTHSGGTVFVWFAYLLLIPVVTFYLLRDWDILVRRLHDLLPRRVEPVIAQLAGECDAVLAQLLRGQLLVMLSLAVVYTVGLWIVGVDLAFLIGLISGLVSFVPYLGFVVGVLFASLAALIQFGDVAHLLYVLLVFAAGQALDGTLLSPLLVGRRIGLHPVAVIFAVLAGGQLFGFLGVLLALPVAAVIVVVLRHSQNRYLQSSLYSS